MKKILRNRLSFKIRHAILIAIIFNFSGCSEIVHIKIYPDFYEVDEKNFRTSSLAIDYVARKRIKDIYMLACKKIPPEDLIKFQQELNGRISEKVYLVISNKYC